MPKVEAGMREEEREKESDRGREKESERETFRGPTVTIQCYRVLRETGGCGGLGREGAVYWDLEGVHCLLLCLFVSWVLQQ